ncbi:ABC transporter, ATP-binding protein [Enterococcus faecalis 13-SD-W-01]|nr:ABC transporter, ATP-binding protein [Enterococcus faecalis 13-SD-W-01]
MGTKLQLYSLSKRYKKTDIFANHSIDTAFYAGEITAITGHNGAGKTTLLKQIIGMTKPTNGSITYEGVSFTQNPTFARKTVAMMPQFHAPLNGVTMRQSIESILRIRGLDRADILQYTNEVMEALKITEWADNPGQKLSGGLQRLTSFAMSVAAAPPILLLDEPTNDVDPVRRQIIWKYLRKLAGKGHIVLVVTHNLLEVEQYADRYLVLEKGKLIKDEYVANQRQVANQLTVFANTLMNPDDFPEAVSSHCIQEELRYEFELEYEQIIGAINWINEGILEKKIMNYRLSPKSLVDVYGEWTNEG